MKGLRGLNQAKRKREMAGGGYKREVLKVGEKGVKAVYFVFVNTSSNFNLPSDYA